MNHQQAVKTVESLLPEMERTKDPESVLLKYSRDQNLPPAQLEKLAQVFNTKKTLSFLKNASSPEERGLSFSVVDTPSLMKAYTDHTHTVALDKAASISSSGFVSAFPSDYEREMSLEKAASRVQQQFDRLDSLKEASELKQKIDWLDQMHEEACEDLVKFATDFYQFLDEGNLHFSDVESDIRTRLGEDRGQAILKFTAKAAKETYEPCELSKYADFDSSCEKPGLRAEALKRASELGDHLDFMLRVQEEQKKASVDMANYVFDPVSGLLMPASSVITQQAGQPHTPGSGSQNAGKSKHKPSKKDTQSPTAEFKQKDRSKKTDLSWLKSPEPLKVKTVQEVSKSLLSAAAKEQNKPQKKVDEAGRDVETTTELRRLMVTDPIIAEADPEEVLDLFNTIQSINPDFVRDPKMLSITLREALEYGSVPIHTLSELAKLRESLGKSQESERRLDEARYKI